MSLSVRDHNKQKSPQMFDRIAPTYDLVNRLLSFRLDISWRRKVGSLLPIKDRLKLLDLATGTGDLVIDLCNSFPDRIEIAFGVDLSEHMLQIGRKKVEKNGLKQKIQMLVGDAMALSMEDQTFDTVTISFGIRNMPDVPRTLREIYRVLEPAGKALILEFSIPFNPAVRLGHLFYLRHILPLVGGLFSGDYDAYRYLNTTIEDFPYDEDFKQLMIEAGFLKVKAHSLNFGIATLYEGMR